MNIKKRKRKNKFADLQICVMLFVFAFSTELQTTLNTPDSLFIGTPFQLSFHFAQTDSFHLTLRPAEQDFLPAIVRHSLEEKTATGWILHYELVALDTGKIEIPALEFTQIIGDKEMLWNSLPQPIFVHSILPNDAQELKPRKSDFDWKKPIPWKTIFWILLAIFLIALAIYLFKKFYRPREKEEVIYKPPPVPIEQAHIVALRELDELKKRNFIEAGQIKLYYSRISEIVRRYVENRFFMPALEMTTEEIRINFDDSICENTQSSHFFTILETSDLVKFAKSQPDEFTHKQVLNFAENFIKKTKQETIKEENKND